MGKKNLGLFTSFVFSAPVLLLYSIIIRLFRIQYKTPIAEACDYFRNSTQDEIARWKK